MVLCTFTDFIKSLNHIGSLSINGHKVRQAEAEVMPSSSLVKLRLWLELRLELRLRLGLGLGGFGFWVWLTFSHVYYFHGWVGGVEKSRIELTSAKLG